jgi:prevent-host-death family protein
MATMNIHEAKSEVSALLQRIENGEEVIIARAGEPVAKLVPIHKNESRIPGLWQDKIIIHDEFDAPQLDEIYKAFEGGDGKA